MFSANRLAWTICRVGAGLPGVLYIGFVVNDWIFCSRQPPSTLEIKPLLIPCVAAFNGDCQSFAICNDRFSAHPVPNSTGIFTHIAKQALDSVQCCSESGPLIVLARQSVSFILSNVGWGYRLRFPQYPTRVILGVQRGFTVAGTLMPAGLNSREHSRHALGSIHVGNTRVNCYVTKAATGACDCIC